MNMYICNKCYCTYEKTKKPFRITQCGHMFCNKCLDDGSKICEVCKSNVSALPLEEPLAPKIASLFVPLNESLETLIQCVAFQNSQQEILMKRFYQIDTKYNMLKNDYRKLVWNMEELNQKYQKLKETTEKLSKMLKRSNHDSKWYFC